VANFLIAGGSKGIGRSLVEQLLKADHQVFVLARNVVDIPGCHYFEADFTSDISNIINQLPDTLNGLVYCPGSITLKPFNRLSPEDFLQDFQINLLGAVRCLQAAQSRLKKSSNASVVLFSSVAAQTGMPYHASIAASKAAIEGLTKSLAAEWAPSIRVNCIAPSLTQTSLAEKLTNTAEKIEAAAQKHPLKRIGQPEEIASLAHFLLSPASSWMTGQVLHLDGGLSSLVNH
jgi:NAD(P)-dependent dehydrogenase (short-subunit alcohol dehydrogenase family)